MLSNQYRQRLIIICQKIKDGEEVELTDMIWAEKLSKSNRSAYEMMRSARRENRNPNADGLDKFLNQMGLGDPDPSNHKSTFDSPEDIIEWFGQDKTDDWRQRD
tara:strand:+ start:6845 stop:7156 length:312 start_codon:yes stop_codon:yes gene_type:complete